MRTSKNEDVKIGLTYEHSVGNWWGLCDVNLTPYESEISENQLLESLNAFGEKLTELTGKKVRLRIERKSVKHFFHGMDNEMDDD